MPRRSTAAEADTTVEQPEPQAEPQPQAETPKATKKVKPKFMIITVGRPQQEKASSMPVIVRTIKYDIPFDKPVKVPYPVYAVIRNATEPYPVVEEEKNGNKKVSIGSRQRFTMVAEPAQ